MEKTDESAVVAGQKDFFRAVILCVLAVVVVRSFVVEPFRIPSSSMVPTLQIGDHIFVTKFNYGFSIPFTKIQFLKWAEPKRGDVVVFLFPRDESLHYIKRVVGVPGDVVEFRGKDLFVNDELIQKEAVESPEKISEIMGTLDGVGEIYEEIMNGIHHYVRYSKQGSVSLSRFGNKKTVPENSFFVSGDNRDDSYDSRSWGFVPMENIRGKAQLIWLSIDQEKGWKANGKFRWDRFGKLIH